MMFVIKSANLLDKCRKGWIEVSHMEKRLVILTEELISNHSLNHSSFVLFLCFSSHYTGNHQMKNKDLQIPCHLGSILGAWMNPGDLTPPS